MSNTHIKKKVRRKYTSVTPAAYYRQARIARAQMLDRAADIELHHGRHHAAERLSHEAAEIRAEGQP